MSKFEKNILKLKFRFNDKEYYAFRRIKTNDARDYFCINPYIVFSGNTLNCIDINSFKTTFINCTSVYQNRERIYTWRRNVFKRNGSKCELCGRDTNLIAHHLDGYNWCIEKRNDPANGVVLCNYCHKKFHSTYGYGYNTIEQYIEFYNRINNQEVID